MIYSGFIVKLDVVVQFEFNWMWSYVYVVVFFYMQGDVGIDSVIGEYVVSGQEFVVSIQGLQGFFQRIGNLWDFFCFFWWQVIQVFIYCFVWMDFVFDIIKVSYQQCCKVQVWVGSWVWEVYFDMMCFWRGYYWNMDRGRVVMGRVSQYNWCFVIWDQMFVGVGGWVCQGVDGFSVFDYVVDVEQCLFRQIGVFVVGEQVGIVFCQRYMVVYVGVVVVEYWFWYKGCGFIKVVSDVVNNVFVNLNFICFFGYGIEVGCYFVLICGCYFMVMGFNNQIYFFYDYIYGGMDVLRRVYWWNWEVIFFYVWMVIFVIVFVFGGGVLCIFNVIDCDMGVGDRGVKMDVVEQEEFWFWFEQDGISDVGGVQVFFSVFCDGVWVMVIVLQGVWFEDIVVDDQGWFFVEWVNDCGGCVWYQDYVRFVDIFLVIN